MRASAKQFPLAAASAVINHVGDKSTHRLGLRGEQVMSTAHATPSNPVRDAIGAVLAAKWWAIALRGILAIIFSIIAFTAPGATMLSLVLVFAAYSLADGVFAFLAIGVARQTGMSWLLLALEGLVDIGAAVAAIALPGLTVLVFVFLGGHYRRAHAWRGPAPACR
jgi:hypothetical protein